MPPTFAGPDVWKHGRSAPGRHMRSPKGHALHHARNTGEHDNGRREDGLLQLRCPQRRRLLRLRSSSHGLCCWIPHQAQPTFPPQPGRWTRCRRSLKVSPWGPITWGLCQLSTGGSTASSSSTASDSIDLFPAMENLGCLLHTGSMAQVLQEEDGGWFVLWGEEVPGGYSEWRLQLSQPWSSALRCTFRLQQ